MPQNNIQLLSTRMLDNTLVKRAAANLLDIECVSFIDNKPLHSEAMQTRIQALANETITAVFTSQNAVNAIAAQLSQMPQWTVFCTGGVTKEYAIKYFGERAIAATAKNATNLAEKLVAANPANPIIFFCGDQRLNDLPEILQSHGKTAEEIIVYTTEQTPVFMEKNYEGVLFFSPSAVHSFFSLNTVPTSVVLFAIGHTTAATIHSYCTNKVVVSQWPGAESMIDLLIEYYEEQAARV